MGQLIIRGAAAAVGFAIGGPTGAQLGWGLGGFLQSSPDKVKRVQGPTLDDLRVFGTEYGQCIPWGRGSICTAGQVWWNTDRIPHETTTTTTESGPGKGDTPSNTTVTTITTYTMDILIGLVDHQIVGVRRIWDNGGLIFSAADDADPDTLTSSRDTTHWDRMTVYTGTATQLPDPDYEAAVGAPALGYRHRAYVFIKGLKLGQSGVLRNLTFEVVIDGTMAVPPEWVLRSQNAPTIAGACSDSAFDPVTGTCVMSNAGYTFVSPDDGLTWSQSAVRNNFGSSSPWTTGSQNGASITFDSTNDRFVTAEPTGNAGNPEGGRYSTTGGSTWTIDTSGFDLSGYNNPRWKICYDADANQLLAVVTTRDGGLPSGRRSSTGGTTWSAVNTLPTNVGFHDVDYGDSAYVIITANTDVHGGGPLTGQILYNLDDPGLSSWLYASAPVAKPWRGVCYAGNDTFVAFTDQLGTQQIMRSTDRGQTWSSVEAAANKTWTSISSDRNGIVMIVASDAGTTTNAQISMDYGETWDLTILPNNAQLSTVTYGRDGRFIASGTVNTSPGDLFFYTFDAAPAGIITRAPPTLRNVCERALEKVWLTNGVHFNCAPLDAVTRPVYSLPVSQVGPMRSTFDVLFTCYFVECRISGGKLVLFPRGGAPVKTIPYAELGAGLGTGTYNLQLPLDSVNDIEVSAKYVMMYRNYSNDYQRGAEPSGDRQVTAVPGTVEEIQIPMGFPPFEAKIIIDAVALEKATSPVRTDVYLLGDHVDLEPGDVFTALDAGGNPYRMRAIQLEDSYPLIKLDSVIESAIITTSQGITDENYEEQIVVSGIADTEAEYLDIPMLTDADNNVGMYVAARGDDTEDPWPGFTLLGSDNDVDFSSMAALSSPSRMGVCNTTLGAPLSDNSVFDETNVLRVNVGPGVVLTSSTHDAVLGSKEANPAVVGSELIQFVTATLVSDGIYDLSSLLRGRNGTEWAMGTHVASERFVMLERGRLTRAAISNSQLAVPRYYKAVTFGRDESTVASEGFTITGVSRKPYAPVYLRATRDASGNAVFTWEHRSRFSTRMYGDAGVNVPLGENTEQYEIEIYSSSAFTTVVRTATVTGAPTFSYTAAMKTADGLTPDASTVDHVRVYQISDVVGRGYFLQGSV